MTTPFLLLGVNQNRSISGSCFECAAAILYGAVIILTTSLLLDGSCGIIVIESSGEVDNDHDPQLVLMQLVICSYDRGIDRQGYVETVNIKEAIMQHFKRKPVFGGAFEVGYPRKWELSDDDMDHYYWGIVNLICKTPNALKNEEVEALI